MGYLCTSCFEIYDSQIKLLESKAKVNDIKYIPCLKSNCSGQVHEIDDLLLLTIIELNKKGYKTTYCCSGHYYECVCECYISFNYMIETLPSIPEGYEVDLDGSFTIRKNFDGLIEEKFYEVIENAKNLYSWAKQLPSYSEFIKKTRQTIQIYKEGGNNEV